ncbi:MAG: helix-turn-helix domain-containing protein [Coriobacteriales bacterium]|jgi:transcriptional regulator with XRE-family HTH domain|nr:helix-turn-helix domain-containing protein [Coriobacteriales bacterium]
MKTSKAGYAASLIEKMRTARGLNDSELAALIQVSPSTVSRIRKGQVCPSYDDMVAYVDRAGYKLMDGALEPADRLIGYHDAKEIGAFVEQELSPHPDQQKVDLVLRTIPKLVNDWRKLPPHDARIMTSATPSLAALPWQAFLEAVVQYFCHDVLWQDAPRWTRRTRLRSQFVPRGFCEPLSQRRIARIRANALPEFLAKNILFSRDEMQTT